MDSMQTMGSTSAKISGETVEQIIFKALANLKEEQGPDCQLDIGPTTALFREDSVIDSLSLVSLIVDIESSLNADYELSISLTDDRAMTRTISPFTDVQALKAYILELVGSP